MLTRKPIPGPAGMAVAEAAEPFIERNDTTAVIALEMFVMQVVKVGVGRYRAFGNRTIKTGMPVSRSQAVILPSEQEMDRV